jgi:hypothetical protein
MIRMLSYKFGILLANKDLELLPTRITKVFFYFYNKGANAVILVYDITNR